jgi:polysaccharide biosynthesis transport protein
VVSEPVVPFANPRPGEEPEGPGIRDFLQMLYRHRWASLLVFAVAVSVGALNSFRSQRVYSSTPALLEITSTGAGVATVRDVFERELISAQNFETLVNVLKSEGILRAAYESLPPDARSKIPEVSFAGGVTAIPVRNCYLVRITFESPWPELNPVAANAVARAFIRITREQRDSRTGRAGRELETRRDELRRRLEESEKALADFHTAHEKADVRSEKSSIDQLLAGFEAKYDEKQLELLSLESAYKEVEAARKAANLERVARVLSDKTYLEMQTAIGAKESERFSLLKGLQSDNDQVKALDAELAFLRERRDRYVDAIVGGIETAYENGVREVEKIRQLRDARREEQHVLALLVVEQTNLEAERDRIRLALDDLVKQANDVVGVTGFDLSQGILHEEARASFVPIRPRHSRDMVIAVFLAGLLAVGVSYLLEQFNDAATRPEEVTRVTGLAILGMLPRRDSDVDRPDLAALEDPQGEISEAVRFIRTSVLFSPSGKSGRSRIMVTSAEPGEGKTLLATNLAITLAQTGQSTMLVDCDLRRPRLHTVFGLDNDRGLTHIFSNGKVKPQTHRVGQAEGSPFEVVVSGPIPPNPAELIGGRRMTEFLEASAREYDRVVIDCPPAGPVSDPALLACQVDAVILVVRLGKTSIRSLRRACDHLQKVGAPLLGVVLNGDTMGGGYQYHYRRYGSYSGGDEKRKKGEKASLEG